MARVTKKKRGGGTMAADRIGAGKKKGNLKTGRVKKGGSDFRRPIKDARLAIISKQRSEMTDARDRLAKIAKGQDARSKLEKIRNIKAGKLEVKRKGNLTMTKTLQGQLILTTNSKRKENAGRLKNGGGAAGGAGATRQTITSRNGARLTTRRRGAAKLNSVVRSALTGERPPAATTSRRAGGVVSRDRGAGRLDARRSLEARDRRSGGITKSRAEVVRRRSSPVDRELLRREKVVVRPEELTRTIRGHVSEADRLDEELMSTHVDPLIIKRSIRSSGNLRRSPSPVNRRYSDHRRDDYLSSRRRSRSPMNDFSRDRQSAPARRNFDYDDPRMQSDRDDYYKMKVKEDSIYPTSGRTMADRVSAREAASEGVSPLQGTKIVVKNLQDSVTQEDITELFSDVGPLKRAKMSTAGVAEVVFVKMEDAKKAVEIYHDRLLDGKAMKCSIAR